MLVAEKNSGSISSPNQTPLCVDLDGTLIAGDLLLESLFALLRQNILYLFLFPFWLIKGKAYFKEQIASRVELDPVALPYRENVLKFLRQEKANGRFLVLATASHKKLALQVADHLRLFEEVLASEGNVNLKGETKLKFLEERFSHTGFDYIGDSWADLPLWEKAKNAYLVEPSDRLLKKTESYCHPKQVFRTNQRKTKPMMKLMRPHQWVKNLLLFAPIVLAHQVSNLQLLATVGMAFFAFSFCASAVYILNDLMDLQSDRHHPWKKRRPLASGAVSIPHAIILFFGLIITGIGFTLIFHPLEFTAMILVYLLVTSAYSFYLKRQPIVDVFVLAGLYTLRILSGGVAAGIAVTPWLIAFSMFFFISLALVKRYSELARAEEENSTKLSHRGYQIEDMALILAVGPASGFMAVITMCLYMNAKDVLILYHSPMLLWIISFILFFWITRVWFLARRRLLDEDPVVFATKDPVSYLSGIAVLAVLFFAA